MAQDNFHLQEVISFLNASKSELHTPVYLYSERALDESSDRVRNLFPDTARIFYSLKANPQPALVRHFSKRGIGAEVGGPGEWYLSTLASMSTEDLLIGGVSKSEEFLAAVAKRSPAALVIESESEWRRVDKTANSPSSLPVLLRIHPGAQPGGAGAGPGARFGLEPDQAVQLACDSLSHDGVEFAGLHFYFGPQRLTVPPILQSLVAAEEVIARFHDCGIGIRIVNLGLGCGVPYFGKEPDLDYALLRDQLQARWKTRIWRGTEVWSEAGRALVAKAGYFVARVTERKRLHRQVFIVVDGGVNVHNPGIGLGGLFRRNPGFLFVCNRPEDSVETVQIVGNLCTTMDCLGRDVVAPRLDEGDLIVIPNSGAYCSTSGLWGFNSQPLYSEGIFTKEGTLERLQPQHELLQYWASS